jgi:hypothetical protein
LAAFVGSGLRVDAMRHLGFARVLINIELRRFQGIMSAARTRAGFGMSSFWIWHFYSVKIQIPNFRSQTVSAWNVESGI